MAAYDRLRSRNGGTEDKAEEEHELNARFDSITHIYKTYLFGVQFSYGSSILN